MDRLPLQILLVDKLGRYRIFLKRVIQAAEIQGSRVFALANAQKRLLTVFIRGGFQPW